MKKTDRRKFIKTAGTGVASLSLTGLNATQATKLSYPEVDESTSQFLFGITPRVNFSHDGIRLTPEQYAKLLGILASEPNFRPDSEGRGGIIEDLQEHFAKITGKENAIYMPSGTMANQLALRVLAEGKSKIYVQEGSHVLNNEGDAAQELHGKRLMPLAYGMTTFSLEELEKDISTFQRREIFRTQVGAISIENPMKSRNEEVFDITELQKLSAFAKQNSLGMHLDGARLHMASAYSGISVKEYASYFDTAYVSLYKYFGASAGAVLCGPRKIIDRMPHLIKISGGNMATNWLTTAVALYFARGFEVRYASAMSKAEALFRELNAINGIRVTPFVNGSSVFKLKLEHGKYTEFSSYLAKNKGIRIKRKLSGRDFSVLKVNETLNFITIDEVVSSFRAAYRAV